MTGTILALNSGSSTLKHSVYRLEGDRETELSSATVKTTGQTPGLILDSVVEHLREAGLAEPSLVGHRIVHGGALFTAPTAVDAGVLERLDSLVALAPLHLPPALALLREALRRWPGALHVACFDTAFHESLPLVARRFALPSKLYERGIRRYGFHGLSCEFVLSVLGSPVPARLVIAHLGSGASLTAIENGRSIDTSMGLTPTGGIPMGTRSGDIDPGVLLHLLSEQGYSAEQLEHLLNHESGLKGLAGSSDMTELLSRATTADSPARAAIELFAYAVKKQIGAYFAALGGLDCLVFTGGIGEHVPLVRELACRNLGGLGIELDLALNASNAPVIGRAGSACQVRVATNEDLVLARSTLAVQRALAR